MSGGYTSASPICLHGVDRDTFNIVYNSQAGLHTFQCGNLIVIADTWKFKSCSL